MTPNAVTSMYLLLIPLFMLNSLLMCMCFILGLFFVNDIPTLVLFDSGVKRSFMSLALTKRFSGAPGELDCPLYFEITDV